MACCHGYTSVPLLPPTFSACFTQGTRLFMQGDTSILPTLSGDPNLSQANSVTHEGQENSANELLDLGSLLNMSLDMADTGAVAYAQWVRLREVHGLGGEGAHMDPQWEILPFMPKFHALGQILGLCIHQVLVILILKIIVPLLLLRLSLWSHLSTLVLILKYLRLNLTLWFFVRPDVEHRCTSIPGT